MLNLPQSHQVVRLRANLVDSATDQTDELIKVFCVVAELQLIEGYWFIGGAVDLFGADDVMKAEVQQIKKPVEHVVSAFEFVGGSGPFRFIFKSEI